MAYICTKPANSCNACKHYRYDDDYGGKACFAAQDTAEEKTKNMSDNTPTTHKHQERTE